MSSTRGVKVRLCTRSVPYLHHDRSNPVQVAPVRYVLLPDLLSVGTAVGVADLHGANRNTQAARVSSRLGDTSGHPDGVGAIDAVGAGEEPSAVQRQVVVLIEGKRGTLAVAGAGLGAGGVAELALAHAGAVGVELLGGGAVGVQVETAVVEVERGRGGVAAIASSVLRGQVQEYRRQGGVELGEVNGACGA